MSEVIVRMVMPKNCPCELSAEVFDPSGNYGGHQPCFAWYGIPARSKEFNRCVVRSERPAWCPIVGELPEQHGDLIDRDALLLECREWFDSKTVAEEDILDAKAIIAAERKDDADYQASVLMQEYIERYEPTYNSEDGSM